MWSIGLDVHQRTSSFCILDEGGRLVKQSRVRGGWDALLAALARIDHPFAICFEASCGYGRLYDRLQPLAQRVVVAHPGRLRLIFRSKKKSDRVDAQKLAMLLLLDQVPAVHVPTVNVREWRSLIEFRHRLVRKRVRVKNGLRAIFRALGIELPRGKRLWTQRGLAELQRIDLPTPHTKLRRDLLLEELSHLGDQLRQVEDELDRIGAASPGVGLLRTIPGVGPRTAEAVAAYVDRADRFARNKRVGSYFGLVPCQDQSADRNRLGHITREGPSTVRKLVTEAAWQGIRRSAHLRAYFDRVLGGDLQRKKIALVATAHHLVRVMHAMLRDGETWRYDRVKESESGKTAA